jgi:hypothetical protein
MKDIAGGLSFTSQWLVENPGFIGGCYVGTISLQVQDGSIR